MVPYSVLLEKCSPLPHRKLGEEFAAVLGVHKQTAFSILRRQQGIVVENVDEERAITLAQYLTDSGFPSKVVDNLEVFIPGKVILCRNADIINDEIKIEDPYGNLSSLDIDRISFVHVGWVEEREKPGDNTKQYFGELTSAKGGSVEGFPWHVKQTTGSIGWTLHIFSDEFGSDYLRILYRRFNYDYQGREYEPPEKKFRRLLYDLKNVIPGQKLDEGVLEILMSKAGIPDKIKFVDIETLMKRIRWMVTLRSNRTK